MTGFLAPGCGGDDDGDGNGGDPDAAAPAVVELADVCDRDRGLFVDVFEQFLSCVPEFELLIGELPGRAELSALCEGSFRPFLDDGTVQLGDIADLEACRMFVADLTCENFSIDDISACDPVFLGMVEIGGDCDDDVQCAGDAYCDTSSAVGCGTCTARLADDQACVENSECSNRNCSDPGGAGIGACRGYGNIGDSCAINEDCLGRQICDRSTGTCASEPNWAVGTSCGEFPGDCAGFTSDLYCNMATGVCDSYAQVGEACMPGGLPPCRIFQSESCQDVGGSNECVSPQVVATGEECGFDIGRDCGAGESCLDHDGDEVTRNTCAARVGVGGDCSASDALCDTLLACVDGTCQNGEHTGMCPAGS